MGVPAFFRWLSKKYPSIVVQCKEEKSKKMDGYDVPVDATQPNPNEVEFDNLYLDMNGIIHPCCHPEDKAAPKDEDEMMEAIFEYIDRIFAIIRPRRLLYMAIDGTAPRAKMNQQRSRRFRAAKESEEKQEDIERIREELQAKGADLPPKKAKEAHFDSNCITPGTPFMARLATCLEFYIHERMNNNPAWQGIKVLLSDANVPGEGEHKIMDYIRGQRSNPDHDPNTHHCLYGADADLIMLGLATHEPNFTILREEFKPNQPRPCELCGQIGHDLKECTGLAKEKEGEFDQFASSTVSPQKEFIFLRLCVLREYLERELTISGLPFPFDLERAIDDWVFMCFFVGNDFLPHLPSLEIREGAIDRLIRLYKNVVPQTHGYLTHNGKVNLARVQLILKELGLVEDEIFQRRRQNDVSYRRRQRDNKRRRVNDSPKWTPRGQFAPVAIGSETAPVQNARQEAYQMRQTASLSANQSAAANLKQQLKGSAEPSNDQSVVQRSATAPSGGEGSGLGQKRSSERIAEDSEPEDEVKLWEDGWKERYYQRKFGVPSDDGDFVGGVVEQYTRGLCWVLGYYYQGCPSWKWFYPYHYAPFASDFKQISHIRNDFNRDTQPFRPLEQLMGVFPEASGTFLPPSWREFMAVEDSPIIDFYPVDFRIDLNGKKYAWQGVALLPFVDEKRLLKCLHEVYPNLTDDEMLRNSRGCNKIFVHRCNKLYPFFKTLYEAGPEELPEEVEWSSENAHGMRGRVSLDASMKTILSLSGKVQSPVPTRPDISKTFVMSSKFQDPHYPPEHIFEAKMLPGAELPDKVLRPSNYSGRYQPSTGFRGGSTAHQRSYSAPDPAQRMVRHSLNDRSSYEMYSSQGSDFGFRGAGQRGYHHNSRPPAAPSRAQWSSYSDQRYPPPNPQPPSYHGSRDDDRSWRPPPRNQYYSDRR
ncbi:5'-3' exoribonuclease 2-like [Halichondria panicea]|uniref:5'-3' exoribonuclease 2-like n=1 Tax=Halichondria panicea TaxID=6063 RepID=UPI00312BC607